MLYRRSIFISEIKFRKKIKGSMLELMNILNINLTDVTDICMDESAVSSDPVIAFLLDEVVVKDWCKRTFKNIIAELQGICILIFFLKFDILWPVITLCNCMYVIWLIALV
jgi:hypothetical protein